MNEVMLALGFFVVALLYASVGHGGATGYLALLALMMPTLPHHEAATTALLLNTMVSGVALVQFSRAGAWSFRQAAPFLIASVPAAFLGGWMRITPQLFSMLLMVGLFAAAIRLMLPMGSQPTAPTTMPRAAVCLGVGGTVGWVSGVVGIGGGVFLSPLLILLRWASPRETAGIAACFVWFNSLAGLLARAISGQLAIGVFIVPMLTALAGGLLGASLGAWRWRSLTLTRLLAIVLGVACFKIGLSMF